MTSTLWRERDLWSTPNLDLLFVRPHFPCPSLLAGFVSWSVPFQSWLFHNRELFDKIASCTVRARRLWCSGNTVMDVAQNLMDLELSSVVAGAWDQCECMSSDYQQAGDLVAECGLWASSQIRDIVYGQSNPDSAIISAWTLAAWHLY